MGILRTLATKALPRTVLAGPRKRFVFVYHDISDPESPQHSRLYSTSVRNFKLQVELLARHFQLVSLDEVVAREVDNHRLASITFDDGFLSVKDEAFSHLHARGIPFTVFVNSMAIKHNRLFNLPGGQCLNHNLDRKIFLDETDIKDLAAEGVVIGSHSSTHKVLVECDEPALKEEVLMNKLYIESLTGSSVKHFALPFGKHEHYNDRVLNFCYSTGHEYAYSTNPSYFDLTDKKRNRRLIPRLGLLNESPEELYFLINRPLLKKIDI